jgi:hypothetical protein
MVAKRKGNNVHPRNPGRERVGIALFGRYIRAKLAAGADAGCRVRSGMVAVVEMSHTFPNVGHGGTVMVIEPIRMEKSR